MNENIEYETIKRCDGIVYKRKKQNKNNFDCHLNIKYHKEKIEELKVIAKAQNTNYNKLVRNVLETYINSFYKEHMDEVE